MFSTIRKHIRLISRAVRAGTIAFAIIGFLIATTGVTPNPSYITKVMFGMSGERYPCENGRCMCASAKECWTNCQCHTLVQKLAWADREGVDVPAYVDRGEAVCRATGEPACPLCKIAEDETDQKNASDEDAPFGLPTLTAAGCKGIDLLFAFGTIVLLPITAYDCEPGFDDCGTAMFAGQLKIRFATRDVPTPPPRAV